MLYLSSALFFAILFIFMHLLSCKSVNQTADSHCTPFTYIYGKYSNEYPTCHQKSTAEQSSRLLPRDLAINVTPKPVSTIPPAIADTPVTAMEKITGTMTITSCCQYCKACKQQRNAHRRCTDHQKCEKNDLSGERFFPADVLYPVVLRFPESVRLCPWELSP